MNLFGTRKPRPFNHRLIYVDERRDKLKEIEDRAKRELGILPPEQFCPEDLKGAFVRATRHLRRRKEKEMEGRHLMGTGILVFLIVVLVAIWYFLNS